MRVLLTGSHGLIGSKLLEKLRQNGHTPISLVRHESQLNENTLLWDPEHFELIPENFEGFDACINLAGENISGVWTEEKKRKIKNSRALRTHMLSEFLAGLQNRPKVMISASAVGYYGSQGEEILHEESPAGSGFLAEVCQAWEEAAKPLSNVGCRVVNPRFGVVLAKNGGALSKMLPPFRFGFGGKIGSGQQYMSWIALDDLISLLIFLLENETLSGPVNAASPNPVTNKAFTKTLGKVLQRPTVFPLPAFLVKLLLGQMGEELLLASQRVSTEKIMSAGFSFQTPELEQALQHILKEK